MVKHTYINNIHAQTYIDTNTNMLKVILSKTHALEVLGKGSFGKVMLCRQKDEVWSSYCHPTLTIVSLSPFFTSTHYHNDHQGASGPLYAMKILRKKELVRRNQLAHTATERQILQNIHHPFLVGIKFAFQSDDKLYVWLSAYDLDTIIRVSTGLKSVAMGEESNPVP